MDHAIKTKNIGLVSGPLSFILVINFFHPEGLTLEANAILASTVWMAIWWITEAIPISVTALLPIILFPLSGGLELSETTASFGHKYVFLYLGGFIIAIAMQKWNLHKRIALNIISFIGTDVVKIILGFMVATAFLSMWISNTATAVMMLPIAMAIVDQLKDNPNTIENENKVFGKALMLGIAFSASIGGISTLIGTPPNLVLAGVVEETFGYEITFSTWFKFGFPISLILLFLCWKYLTVRWAMASWAKTLSNEVAEYGITVNNILPGFTDTERLRSLMKNRALSSNTSTEEITNNTISNIPAKRFGKPEEVADATAFLCSKAASYINGINLPVDGGFSKSL